MKHLRKIILAFTSNFIFLFALHASSIEANVAVIKLTPPLEMGYTLGGYGARMSKPAEGIHDDIGGLANQWISYILSENEYHKSGYDGNSNPLNRIGCNI